ncbi:hypothetical protein NHQ30_009170 [Ciborinia camelliae]|nr:hypothetical protein NHQ30_009170 [Ciborinia camelliae]
MVTQPRFRRELARIRSLGIPINPELLKQNRQRIALYQAVKNNEYDIVRNILGSDTGISTGYTDADGCKLLYIAAASGYTSIVELLLQHHADVESYNSSTKRTALYQAVENGHREVATILLDRGADIETRSEDGWTPLINAVKKRDLNLVELLLKRGASTKIQLMYDQTLEDLAEGDNELKSLLLSHQVLDGPLVLDSESDTLFAKGYEEADILNSGERDAKFLACHGFQATIIDFFDTDREQRVHVSKSIYDILYGDPGPEAIMKSAISKTTLSGRRPRLRWYHLPSNNMEWVETLVARILQERGITMGSELRSRISLTNSARRQYCTTTAHSSFMRPICRAFEPAVPKYKESLKTLAIGEQVMLFKLIQEHIPYLHFETHDAYLEMARTMSKVKGEQEPSNSEPIQPTRTEAELLERDNNEHVQTIQEPTLRTRRQNLGREIRHQLLKGIKNMAGVISAESKEVSQRPNSLAADTGDHDLEKGMPSRNQKQPKQDLKSRPSIEMQKASRDTDKIVTANDERIHTLQKQKSAGILTQLQPESHSGNYTNPKVTGLNLSKSKSRLVDEGTKELRQESIEEELSKTDPESFDELLMKGYLPHKNTGQIPPLQLRRTLDQYFYTHLEISGSASSSTRDNDQVVYRFTKDSCEPKMFMVDQLWLWIINDDTVISCCPQRWDVMANVNEARVPDLHDMSAGPSSAHIKTYENEGLPVHNEARRIPDSKIDSDEQNNKPNSFQGKKQRQIFLDKDPLNVHQMVLKHLQRTARPSIQSAYQLAKLITDTCANIFNPYDIPDEFQFFEFFERSIGSLIDKEAKCYLEFVHMLDHAHSANIGSLEKPSFNITAETHLLVEIKDIRDELGILRMVLTDQLNVMNEFTLIAARGDARVQKRIKAENASVTSETQGDTSQVADKGKRPLEEKVQDQGENKKRSVFQAMAGFSKFQDKKERGSNHGTNGDYLMKNGNDSQETTDIFTRILNGIGDQSKGQAEGFMTEKNKVLESHLYRIDQMDQLAEKTYVALNHLLDLKQKQANISEAESAHRQANESLDLARLAQVQADQSAQQGKTVMVFTVVTILFVGYIFGSIGGDAD